MPKKHRDCLSCDVISINGTRCHEIGCPESWKDYDRECYYCGQTFKPKDKDQQVCKECLNNGIDGG